MNEDAADPAVDREPAPPPAASYRAKLPIGWGRIVLLTPIYVVLPLVWALGVRAVGFEAFEFEGPSMEPTILQGDRIVVDKHAYGLWIPFTARAATTWGVPEPGDVVVVKSPHDGIDIIKRVIGIPGDRIEIRDDIVHRNGVALEQHGRGSCAELEPNLRDTTSACFTEVLGEISYGISSEVSTPPYNLSPIEIPAGHVFILGDHRDRSNDSRFFGSVPIDALKGRVLFVYWSPNFDRIGTWAQ